MTTFHLSVVNLSYENKNTAVGDVAEYLEERYQIMQAFFDRYGNDIADLMSKGLAANLGNTLAGVPSLGDSLAESMSRAYDLFVAFLGNEEVNGMSGVPARHALLGISRCLENRRGGPRAPFINIGNYQAAMRAWVSGVLSASPE